MPQREYIDQNYFYSGFWYYKFRALVLSSIAKNYGLKVASLLKKFESFARLKWKKPYLIQWNTETFSEQMMMRGLSYIAPVYRGNFDLPVIVPRDTFFYDAFASFPNLNTVYGERGSGKTIMAWITAYHVFKKNKNKFKDMKVYVYGDVDGLSDAVINICPDEDFANSIITVDDYQPAKPEPNIGKIIIYNEIDETLMSSSTPMSKEQKAIAEMIFRSRHYQYWMIYNVIRFNSIFKTVRISSSFRSFKPLSEALFEEVIQKGFVSPLRVISMQAISDLSFKEAFISIPLYRADLMGFKKPKTRQAYIITPIEPPKWLLDATRKAEKNFDTGANKMLEREQKMIEKGAKMWLDEDLTVSVVASIMAKDYNFQRSATWWRGKIADYYRKKGYTFKDLKELKENDKMGRILAQIS